MSINAETLGINLSLRIISKYRSPDNDTQGTAIKKLVDIAVGYDLGRDGTFVHQCFSGGKMSITMLERQLLIAFKAKFTEEECKELIYACGDPQVLPTREKYSEFLSDLKTLEEESEETLTRKQKERTKKKKAKLEDQLSKLAIDCKDFLACFFELGLFEKGKSRVAYVKKRNAAIEKREKAIYEKEQAALKKASNLALPTYTQDDMNNALEKLKKAASVYDRYHPSTVQPVAFEAQSMPWGRLPVSPHPGKGKRLLELAHRPTDPIEEQLVEKLKQDCH